MKKYYAVIDTNVLVSALLNRSSTPGEIVRYLLDGTIIPLLHTEIIEEYRDVLTRPKFGWKRELADEIIGEIEACGIFTEAFSAEDELPDPDDRIFYEVVMEGRKTEDAYLVTGNIKHFPRKTFVVTPRQMLDIIDDMNDEDLLGC